MAASDLDLTRPLAAFAAGFRPEMIPDEAMALVRRALLDYTCAALAGSTTGDSRAVRAYVAAAEAGDGAGLVGSRRRFAPHTAAFLGGVAAHGLELDDSHSGGAVSPGAIIFPAALAAAQAYGAGGEGLAAAVLVGYDAVCRLSAAVQPHLRDAGFHSTGVFGAIGAACAVGHLLGLGEEAMVRAVGLAAAGAGGMAELTRGYDGVGRLACGRAARDGVLAAELARRGINGPPLSLEQTGGLIATITRGKVKSGRLDWPPAAAFAIGSTSINAYPYCRLIHPVVSGALRLVADHSVTPDQIAVVRVETARWAAAHSATQVHSVREAQMSIPHAVAAAIALGRLDLAAFGEAARHDPEVQDLSERVVVAAAPGMASSHPGRRGTRVVITLRDGRRLALVVQQNGGDSPRGLGDDEVAAKLFSVCTPLVGEAHCRRLIAACRALDLPAYFDLTALDEDRLPPAAT